MTEKTERKTNSWKEFGIFFFQFVHDIPRQEIKYSSKKFFNKISRNFWWTRESRFSSEIMEFEVLARASRRSGEFFEFSLIRKFGTKLAAFPFIATLLLSPLVLFFFFPCCFVAQTKETCASLDPLFGPTWRPKLSSWRTFLEAVRVVNELWIILFSSLYLWTTFICAPPNQKRLCCRLGVEGCRL